MLDNILHLSSDSPNSCTCRAQICVIIFPMASHSSSIFQYDRCILFAMSQISSSNLFLVIDMLIP